MVYLEKKILIHTEPNMQDVIQACLTTFAGWNVRVANSTLEGVQQAILSQPEAIILEVSVGEIDGLRFLKQLSCRAFKLYIQGGRDAHPTRL